MIELIKVIILGIIQGLTEFLPVSSSAHLVLGQHLLGVEKPGITLEIFLHIGTLVSVFIVFWKDILEILKFKQEYRKFTLFLIIGTIPAVVVGLGFKGFFEGIFSSLYVVGFMLLITGSLLWISDRIHNTHKKIEDMTLADSIVVGCAQAFAIFPGISRSGTTITAGLLMKLNRDVAARFSFLLSIPVIAGAALLDIMELLKLNSQDPSIMQELNMFNIGIGTIFSGITGYFAIRFLLMLIKKEKLSYFAYYCWTVGTLTLLYMFFMV